MAGESRITTNHGEIQRWVEKRGGHPARVKGTENRSAGGLLRIDYPGFTGEETLKSITWEEFFKTFDEHNLAFLYQDKTKDGKVSRFSKFIDRDSAEAEKSRAAHSA